jgi:hypothetical protein
MQLEVIDKFGRVRPLRRGESLADGDRLRVPHMFMDAVSRDARDTLVQKYGWHDHQPQGFRRGYAFADTTPPRNAQEDAAAAYDERSARLQNAWRKNHRVVADDAPPATQDARAVADRAWQDKKQRLQNSWRNR